MIVEFLMCIDRFIQVAVVVVPADLDNECLNGDDVFYPGSALY